MPGYEPPTWLQHLHISIQVVVPYFLPRTGKDSVNIHPRSLLRREINVRVVRPLELVGKDIKVLQRLLGRQILHLLRGGVEVDGVRRALAVVSAVSHRISTHVRPSVRLSVFPFGKVRTGAPRRCRGL